MFKISKITLDNSDSTLFEIIKVDENNNIIDVGLVENKPNGKWFSDDSSFIRLRNESANKRIKLVKKYIEIGQPSNVLFSLTKNNIKVHGYI